MPIDAFTLLLLCGAIQLLLGALLLFIWLQDRPAAALASWGCAFCFAALAAFPFAKSGLIGDGYVAPASSGAFAIMAFVCFWQGARAFDGQRILWLHSLLPLGLWLLANLEHGFAENVARRLALAALIAFSLTAMTALEFWRGRHEPLQSRPSRPVGCFVHVRPGLHEQRIGTKYRMAQPQHQVDRALCRRWAGGPGGA